MGNVKFRGVLALGVVLLSLGSCVTANHLCAISSICVHPARPVVLSLSSISSDCAIFEVIWVSSDVPVVPDVPVL